MGNSELSSFVELDTMRIHKQMYNVRRWHGYSGISVSSVPGWYGGFGEFVTGMPIRELLTSAKLAIPFTNVRKWSGAFVNGGGSWVAWNMRLP